MDRPITQRPMTTKGSGRVQDILKAARDILVEKGFASLSYGVIARRVGIAVGNVNYYYPSKDQLMVELAEYIFDRWDERFRRDVPARVTTPIEMFLYSVNYMIEENKRAKTRSLLFEMWAMANHSEPVAKMMDAFYTRMRCWIEEMLAQINPAISASERAHRAALITAQIEGMMILIGPGRRPHQSLRELEAAALEHIKRLALAP
jgi:AcrR family transcriptional regulator